LSLCRDVRFWHLADIGADTEQKQPSWLTADWLRGLTSLRIR
jgi:hypothetical protein